MDTVVELPIVPGRALIHEQGWQSWSPTTIYPVGTRAHRPANEQNRVMSYRPEVRQPDLAYQGEGLLAIDPGDGSAVTIVAAADGRCRVPSIRAEVVGAAVRVSSDGDVEVITDDGVGGGIDAALARWADRLVRRWSLPTVRPAPTTWCSWYHYFTEVTEADIDENIAAIDRLELPVEFIQLDDGYQAEIGDWLELSDRFASLEEIVGRIRATGRRAGLWVAPFLVGGRSRIAAEHPDWLVTANGEPIDPGRNWGQRLAVLDTTHPGAQDYLCEVFSTLRDLGVELFKVDFVYAGAMPGHRHGDATAIEAYRHGLRIIRESIADAYLLGCGAPMLPSVGLVDAMRISADTAPHHEPESGDLSQPSSRAAELTGAGRAFMHGRFWANDPDCLLVRPSIERRQQWAAHVERFGGLRSSSDRIDELDHWGLETTRRLLAESPTATFIPS